MSSKTLHSITSFLLALFVVSSILFNTSFGVTVARAQSTARIFSLPLGYQDGVSYGPRINYRDGQLIEDSEYGVMNPDMQGNTCFGVDWGQIYHAGEDWYREDGQSTSQAGVSAVADGIVKYLNFNFPGAVIIIEHSLPPDGQQKIYSLYGHLDPNSVVVSVNQEVLRGQELGAVMLQYFDGRYTDYHDDSHLHFEMRFFYDASNIYVNYPNCNGYLPGRGYTYPQHPDDFPPSQSERYTDPIAFVQSHTGVFLPLIIKQEPPCISGSALVFNGNFEQGPAYWTQQGTTIIYNNPPHTHGGSWGAWLAGYSNANDTLYQTFYVPNGAISASLVYYVWIGTDETSAPAYDYLRVRLRNEAGSLLSTIDTLNDNSTKNTWLRRSYTVNLGSYVGQTLRISFEATTNGTLTTNFYVDDVSLTLNCGAASGNSQEGSETEKEPTQPTESNAPLAQPRKPTPTPNPYP